MSRRLTTDSLLKEVPVRLNAVSSATVQDPEHVDIPKNRSPKSRRARGRIHPGYLGDQALVQTRYLPPDTTGCPRFKFYASKKPEYKSRVTLHKNALIDTCKLSLTPIRPKHPAFGWLDYPIVEHDYSEDYESHKSHYESPNMTNSGDFKSSDVETIVHLRSRTTNLENRLSFDSRTYTIYSCKSNPKTTKRTDNPQPEGQIELKESCDTISGLECFSQLHERIEKLEEKLQKTLEETIKVNKTKRKKSNSVQKLFQMISGDKLQTSRKQSVADSGVSGTLERNDKSTVQHSSEADYSDTESEIRNIKKRLHNLEQKLKREKKLAVRKYHQSTSSSSIFKIKRGDGRRIVSQESEYTEPLESESDSYIRNKYLKIRKKVKQTFFSKCRILRGHKKLYECAYQTTERETTDRENIRYLVNNSDQRILSGKSLNWEWKKNPKNKREKNNRSLCKKNSKMNLLLEENGNVKNSSTMEETIHSWTFHQTDWKPCKNCPCRGLSVPLPMPPDTSHNSPHASCLGSKFQNPLDFFKREGIVKMPIFFKIVHRGRKPAENVRKSSKETIKFLFTKQQKKKPLVTLKRLVKNWSQTFTSDEREDGV